MVANVGVAAAVFAAVISAAGAVSGSSHSNRILRVGAAGSKAQFLTAESASKPVRVVRGGAKAETGGKQQYGKEAHLGTAKCGETIKVNSASDKSEVCPQPGYTKTGPVEIATDPGFLPKWEEPGCPFYAQDKTDDQFCTFRCVAAEDCAKMNPKTPIADNDMGVCRSCTVDNCKTCHPTATEDTCSECQSGFRLVDGKCKWKYSKILNYVLAVLGGILLLVALWVVDICIRPVANEPALRMGMELRESQKLRRPKDEFGRRELWPLSTNLCSQLVAGPGMILHFNFQAAIIVWAALVSGIWFAMAYLIDPDLLILGTRRFGTPRENCILVAWGYERQKELMWTKVLFLEIVYGLSFVLHLLHCVRQLRMFQAVDFENKTMKDFVAIIEDMPRISGEQKVEEQLRETVARESGVDLANIVGVSVAWNYEEVADDVRAALDKGLDSLAEPPPELPPGEAVYRGPIRRWLFRKEKAAFGEESGDEDEDEEADAASLRISQQLCRLRTSPNAFVVFQTEATRDAAVEALQGGFAVKGAPGVSIRKLECEPDTVMWENYTGSTTMDKALRLLAGFGCIFLACFLWGAIFYAPYAWYVMNFNYENGRQPGFYVSFAFSMIVVIGNAIMYEVCARIADKVGFRFKDHREACYMILYTIACLFNVLLDFVTTYYTAYLVMVGLGFRTYFGEKLEDIDEFTKQFETYGMQRALAENTFGYAFPSTYLIPFIIEPVVTIGLPLKIGQLIVRTHPEIQGRAAEEWVASVPLDMGRYADLLLNVILGLLIFYFPGGYTAKLFMFMALSHIYIYCFDHWKILRNIPSVTIASMDIDWWSQALLIPCVGLIASCLVFKYNCDPAVVNRLTGIPLIVACCAAFVMHCVVHLLLLLHLVPLFGKTPPPDEGADMTFEELAHKQPCSWFTANPIHCLRSQHVYLHNPPCMPFHLGKERHMRVNKKIGCYFEEAKQVTPRY